MVEISLGENGGFYGYTQFFHGSGELEEMFITECCRCLGVIIIWKRKECKLPFTFVSRFAATGFHLPSYERNARQSKRQFFRIINDLAKVFEPKYVYYCGTKIDTKQNQFFAETSLRYFVWPFLYLFPSIIVEGLEPSKDQACSTMYMDDDFGVFWDTYFYTD